MSNNTKHVVHHRGSPREDSDGGGWLLLGGILAAIAIFNAIVAMLPFLLAGGVISLGTYLFLNSSFAKIKFKQSQLQRIQKRIDASRVAEELADSASSSLNAEDRKVALEAAEEETRDLITQFDSKREEITSLLNKSLERMKESRNTKIQNANKAKSSEKFRCSLEKLDEAIEKLENSISEIEAIDP